MAWDTPTAATQLTSITTEQFFDELPAPDPGELIHLQIKITNAGSTDGVFINFYGSIDGGTDYSGVPFASRALVNADKAKWVDFFISGPKKFRVGITRDGSTDTISADMEWVGDGISV